MLVRLGGARLDPTFNVIIFGLFAVQNLIMFFNARRQVIPEAKENRPGDHDDHDHAEEENRRLKHLVADLSLDREVLKAVISKNGWSSQLNGKM